MNLTALSKLLPVLHSVSGLQFTRESVHYHSCLSSTLLLSAAPPSSPLCLWDGQADEGGSISLSCSVEEGVPVPELRWDKLEPDQISLPVNKEGMNCFTTIYLTYIHIQYIFH